MVFQFKHSHTEPCWRTKCTFLENVLFLSVFVLEYVYPICLVWSAINTLLHPASLNKTVRYCFSEPCHLERRKSNDMPPVVNVKSHLLSLVPGDVTNVCVCVFLFPVFKTVHWSTCVTNCFTGGLRSRLSTQPGSRPTLKIMFPGAEPPKAWIWVSYHPVTKSTWALTSLVSIYT